MFHWICPECGREIPPSVKECPACDPSAAPVPEAAKAPAEQVEEAAETVPETPAPEVVASAPEVSAVTPEVVTLPAETTPDLDPLAALAEQVREAQNGTTDPAQSVSPSEPAPVAQTLLPAEMVPADTTPAVETAPIESAPVEAPPTLEVAQAETPRTETAPPEPPDERAPAASDSPGLAELANAVGVSQIPESAPETAPQETSAAAQEDSGAPVTAGVEPPPLEVAASEPSVSICETAEPVALIAQPAEPTVAPLLLAAAPPETVAPPLILNGVDVAPAPSVPEPATAPLATETPALHNPPSGSRLPMAPLNEYTRGLRRMVRPAAPDAGVKATDAGPAISLPGPALPPNLASFQDANIATESNQKSKKSHTPKEPRNVPGWLVSFLVMAVLLGLGVATVFYLVPLSRSNADSKEVPADTQVVVTNASHPLAQSIEVTGFRFVLDPNKKSEIHYVVINHSAAPLSDLTVYVTLRGANAKPGQAPLSRFSFKSPDLAPFEAKEMISSIERISRSITLPDWSDLRAEVQVAQR